MFTIILDGAGQLSGNFRRFGEVAAHSASQCIHQDTFYLMDCLGGQSVIVQVTHKGTEHLGCPVHGCSSRTSKHRADFVDHPWCTGGPVRPAMDRAVRSSLPITYDYRKLWCAIWTYRSQARTSLLINRETSSLLAISWAMIWCSP